MIPVLFKADATEFDSYGLGVLADCLSCEVTEERNGAFELVLKYPITGRNFAQIRTERLIKAKPNDTAKDQMFRVYRVTTPLDGVVTVYAQHISYDLSNVAALQWSSKSISPALAMNRVFQDTATPHHFTCQTDYSAPKPFSVSRPQSVRACLGGVAGSFLDLWGGEYEWDNFKVIHHQGRGNHTGVVIEYGKNLTSLEHDNDSTEVYTDLLPYAVHTADDGTETVITLTEVLLPITDSELVQKKTLIKDFTDSFDLDEEITEEKLRARATSYLDSNPLGAAIPTLTVAFEPLWKQPEYAAVLERVSLCDTVTVRHTVLGITAKTKVITTVYDTLAEKYVSITLGNGKANLINEMQSSAEKTAASAAAKAAHRMDRFPTLIQEAIKDATATLTGQTGGYVVLHTDDETGQPYELLILDAPSIEEAVNVWRWNVGGLGFSKNGYNGPYETAITADGQIVADFITSGTLVANIIRAGVIQSLDGESWWDLESGEVHLVAYATSSQMNEVTNRITVIEQTADGLNSYVAGLTETVENMAGGLEEEQQRVIAAEKRISELEQSMNSITMRFTEEYIGGMNYVQNSAGLNGLTDEWVYSGTVKTDSSTDTQNNTAADSAFVLGATSTLKQTITGLVTGRAYTLSLRAKKTYSSYSGYCYIKYNGSKLLYPFNTTATFGWTDYSVTIDEVSDPTIEIYFYSRQASLYVSDIMLTEGTTVHKWTPAPNEIYTEEVKIDRRGIEVSNSKSSQRTVITNTEFSGYYNDERIFSLNKDETQTKKTTVDGELTVGKTKFVPMATASQGLNIVILD